MGFHQCKNDYFDLEKSSFYPLTHKLFSFQCKYTTTKQRYMKYSIFNDYKINSSAVLWIWLKLYWLSTRQTLHNGAHRRVRVQLGLVGRHNRPELCVLRQLDRRLRGYKLRRRRDCDGDSGRGTAANFNIFVINYSQEI